VVRQRRHRRRGLDRFRGRLELPTESRRLIRRTCTPDRRSLCLRRLARSRCRPSRRRSRFPLTTRPPEISGVCSGWIFEIQSGRIAFTYHTSLITSLRFSSTVSDQPLPVNIFCKSGGGRSVTLKKSGEAVSNYPGVGSYGLICRVVELLVVYW